MFELKKSSANARLPITLKILRPTRSAPIDSPNLRALALVLLRICSAKAGTITEQIVTVSQKRGPTPMKEIKVGDSEAKRFGISSERMDEALEATETSLNYESVGLRIRGGFVTYRKDGGCLKGIVSTKIGSGVIRGGQ